MDKVLNNNINDINITIKADTIISKNDLEKIKSSGKKVNFNYFNDDKNIVYSWIIDGSKLKSINDLITTITSDSEYKKDILRLSNYADGLFIDLKQVNNLPEGIKLKMFVGGKYKDNDLINLYAYIKNNDKLELVNNKIAVENGYIEFEVDNVSNYFITMSNVPTLSEVVPTNGTSNTVLLIIIGILSLLVIGLIIIIVIKNKKNIRDDNFYNQLLSNKENSNYEVKEQNNNDNLNI